MESNASEKDCSTSTKIPETKEGNLRQNIETSSGMILSAFENNPLCVVADAVDEPAKMLKLLDARYASN